jgi:signal transduction histidine kinase
MSLRLRMISGSLVAMLVTTALSMASGFLLFMFAAGPYVGERIGENLEAIASRYFLLGAVVVLALTGFGALRLIVVTIKHVTGPLRRLKRAAEEIGDGNLNYELAVNGNDEFAELAACFEQMRIRLKDTLRMRDIAETERRAMMAYITHDLQTPITSIIGYSEGILDGVASTPEKLREYVGVIVKKARSLQSLAGDLALLSRIENAELPLDRREEDIGAFAAEIATEFSLSEPTLRLETHLEPGLTVLMDREKMARVIVNLLQNSMKYKKPEQESAEVSVTLKRQNGDALLTVSDNGIGAALGEIGRLFDKFYRADASRGLQSGSGLGLAIARGLVHQHGGKIWIVSNKSGGLSVNITMPLCGK